MSSHWRSIFAARLYGTGLAHSGGRVLCALADSVCATVDNTDAAWLATRFVRRGKYARNGRVEKSESCRLIDGATPASVSGRRQVTASNGHRRHALAMPRLPPFMRGESLEYIYVEIHWLSCMSPDGG